MRYLYLLFFFFLSIHSYFAFAYIPGDGEKYASCTGSNGGTQWCSSTVQNPAACSASRSPTPIGTCSNGGTLLICRSECSCKDGMQLVDKICKCPAGTSWQALPAQGQSAGVCAPISCPDGETVSISSGADGNQAVCVDLDDQDGDDCQLPNVKNIETGACEAKTDCEYPLLYDSYSNSCFANPNHCAEGSKPNPIDPGTCIAYGDTSCPNGWVPINDGLNCAPSGNASSAAGASSAPPASSAAAASSTPASTPASTPTSSPSSTPSDGGDDSGSGDGGGGGSGSGGNSGTGGTGSGSASSSNSSGAGSGDGSGGSGECDPTSPDYLDCISRDTGDEGEGLDDVNQKDYGLNIGDRLQQARDDYTDRLNQIQDEFSQSVSVSLGSGSGSLPRNTVTLYGESVEMGIYARRDFFDAIRWIFLAVATVLSLYIVLSR